MSYDLGFISYRRPRTVISESVYQFLHGLLYGAAWGLVTPIPAVGSAAAAKEAASGIFRPIPPFGALSAVPANAIFFGSILGFQRLCAKSLELARKQESITNELFGFGMIWPYHQYILNHSERRLRSHNRIVGGALAISVLYANLLA
jgi:hypothetical protein